MGEWIEHDDGDGDIIRYRLLDTEDAEPVGDGGPAFAGGDPVHGGHPGMTLRAYAAVAALQGIGAWMPPDDGGAQHTNLNHPRALYDRAKWAVRQADALLAALAARKEKAE